MIRRIIAFTLCCSLLLLSLPSANADAPYMGGGHTYYRSHTYKPAELTQYTVNSMRHTAAGLAEEHILSYLPNAGLVPVTVGPNGIYNGAITIEEAAAKLRERGYDVVGGINASFSNGNMTVIGLQVRDGILTSYDRESTYLPSVGFTGDGSMLVGDPGISIKVSTGGGSVSVDKLNKARNPDLVYMYTRDFAATTQTTQDGTHVVMRVSSGSLSLGGTLTGTVTRVLRGTAAYTIASDEIVLSASTQSAIDRIAFLTEGSAVTVTVECADVRWYGVSAAVVGRNYLVRNGQVTDASDGARAPRTAAGIRADGSVVLYTVDGRQAGYSTGLTLREAAERLLDMGCVVAAELDGGGSTAMMVRMPGESSAKIINKPSDGQPRRNADFILLCNVFPASDGRASYLFPQPAYVTMMPGATAGFSVLATDYYYRAVTPPSGSLNSYSEDSSIGFSSGQWFTAVHPGETTINFESYGAVGTAHVSVVGRLDAITLTDSETGLTVNEVITAPGQSLKIAASGTYNNAPVLSTPASFYWSVEGDVGTITSEGVFTASSELGKTGRIIVTGGGLTAILPVSVGAEPLIIEDFSMGLGILSSGSGSLTAKTATDPNVVERGFSTAALSYSFTQTAAAPVSIPISGKLPGYPTTLSLLVTGDGSGHELCASVTSVTGVVTQISFGKLDFTGAKYLTAALPAKTASISGLTLIPRTEGPLSGTIYLQQIVAVWTDSLPNQPPDVQISAPRTEGDELVYTVTATDWNGTLPKDISVRWDGEPLSSPDWDIYTGRGEVRVPLPGENGGLHLLSVDAVDSLGRRVRKISSDFWGRRESASSIWDTADKWYTGYVDFLDDRHIIDTEDIFGLRYYDPEKPVTRLEVMRMLYRVLKLDPSTYGSITLPFEDIATLTPEDITAVKAVYGYRIVSGKTKDGKLYLDPAGIMTRSELFTVLNKTIPRGYERSSLTEFSDTSSVPSFALRATQTLVGMKVVSGSDSKVNPLDPIKRSEVCSLFCRFFY